MISFSVSLAFFARAKESPTISPISWISGR